MYARRRPANRPGHAIRREQLRAEHRRPPGRVAGQAIGERSVAYVAVPQPWCDVFLDESATLQRHAVRHQPIGAESVPHQPPAGQVQRGPPRRYSLPILGVLAGAIPPLPFRVRQRAGGGHSRIVPRDLARRHQGVVRAGAVSIGARFSSINPIRPCPWAALVALTRGAARRRVIQPRHPQHHRLRGSRRLRGGNGCPAECRRQRGRSRPGTSSCRKRSTGMHLTPSRSRVSLPRYSSSAASG